MFYSKSSNGFYCGAIHRDLMPSDAVEISDADYGGLLAGQSVGKIIIADAQGYPILQDPPALSVDQLLNEYEAVVDARLDQFAQGRGYRHGDRLASYQGSANATWAAEASRFIELRESTWTKFISISDDIKSGKRVMPTLDDLLLELPVLSWDDNV